VPQASVTTVNLKFYLGPFELLAPGIKVFYENCGIKPNSPSAMAPPDAAVLPQGVVGFFRRSEPCLTPIPVLGRSGGLLRYVERSYERRFIDLSGDFNLYLAKFSGRSRSSLKRKVRKFADLSGGTIDWRLYRTADEMMQFHAHARAVSKVSYQERLFDTGIGDDDEFVAAMCALAREDRVRAYVLYLHGVPVSYLYCSAIDGRLEYTHLGFVPEYARHSPGTVLRYLALEQIFAERAFQFFDFSEGDDDHKRLFSTLSVPCANVYYLKCSPRTVVLVLGHRLMSIVSKCADALIDRIGFKTRLRKMLHGVSPS
jgi:hypothetical protein